MAKFRIAAAAVLFTAGCAALTPASAQVLGSGGVLDTGSGEADGDALVDVGVGGDDNNLLDVDVGGGEQNGGIGADVDLGSGSSGGLDANVDVGNGSSDGVNAGVDAGVGGSSGADFGVEVGVGGGDDSAGSAAQPGQAGHPELPGQSVRPGHPGTPSQGSGAGGGAGSISVNQLDRILGSQDWQQLVVAGALCVPDAQLVSIPASETVNNALQRHVDVIVQLRRALAACTIPQAVDSSIARVVALRLDSNGVAIIYIV